MVKKVGKDARESLEGCYDILTEGLSSDQRPISLHPQEHAGWMEIHRDCFV